nr:MAG TPA: Protein of unknown function (DUF1043) [Caudoviricetes sp.]
MYDKIKVLLNHPTYRYIIIGGIGFILILCLGYIFHQPSGSNNHDSLNTVERIEKQQRESLELNRSVQRSIDRSADYSREAATRIERSSQYNQQIGERINASQTSINEARNCLVRNAELFDRVERANRQRQENNQTLTNATQPIPNTGSGRDNRSSNSSMIER